MSDSGFSASFEKSIIDVAFNTFVSAILLSGIYTTVYAATLYIYLSKKSAGHWIVTASITSLYVLYIVPISVQWSDNRRTFVDQGQTSDTIFASALNTRPWVTFVNATCSLLQGTIADSLLIWRCFNVWDRSIRVIGVPSLLLLCELALNLAVIVISAPNNYLSSQRFNLDRLISAATFITFGTTLLATLLIAYRIHSVTKQELVHSSKTRFNHILDMLVQSAAIYSAIAAASAIATVMPFSEDENQILRLLTTQTATSVLYSFIAGISPTIIVARVALASDTTTEVSTSTRISGLQFHDRFAASHSTESRLSQIENGDAIPVTVVLENVVEKKQG